MDHGLLAWREHSRPAARRDRSDSLCCRWWYNRYRCLVSDSVDKASGLQIGARPSLIQLIRVFATDTYNATRNRRAAWRSGVFAPSVNPL